MGLIASVTPRDCVFLYGIPTTTQEFKHAVNSRSSDFTNGLSLERFEGELLSDFRRATKALEHFGVTVYRGASSATVKSTLAERWPVMILYSHWIRRLSAIELYGGGQSAEQFVALVPAEYNGGLIDLTVCTPEPLALSVVFANKGAFVKWGGVNLDAKMWLWFYIVLFRVLSERPMPYLDAFSMVMKMFMSEGEK